ncbi:hypothetical protein HMPREF9056_02737 [Actinomyces sp. oral taxon 170 str. F0386]|nr:hypothetical protein HMPREF9056_02737 [Actinomyces sp. oral taxon 170 str. F0386]
MSRCSWIVGGPACPVGRLLNGEVLLAGCVNEWGHDPAPSGVGAL